MNKPFQRKQTHRYLTDIHDFFLPVLVPCSCPRSVKFVCVLSDGVMQISHVPA